jgi:hypothetical protein
MSAFHCEGPIAVNKQSKLSLEIRPGISMLVLWPRMRPGRLALKRGPVIAQSFPCKTMAP